MTGSAVDGQPFYRLLAGIYGVALFIYNEARQRVEERSAYPKGAAWLLSLSGLQERILQRCAESGQTQIFSSEFGQLWAGVPLRAGELRGAIALLGPVFTSGGSTNLMLDYARSYNISKFPRETLLDALNRSPVVPYAEFTRLIAVLYAHAHGVELDASALSIVGLTNREFPFDPALLAQEEAAAPREDDFAPTIAFEEQLLDCISTGDLEGLKRLLRTSRYGEIHQLSLPDPIRQQKDMFISLVTQATSAAIRGGLHPQTAYMLYDRYIQQVETLANLLPVISLTREMLYDYTTRVARLMRAHEYPKMINDCCNYIHEHIYEDLRVPHVAAAVQYNAYYLSQMFRQATRQSIPAYIRAAKVAEAKRLLKYSRLSLAEISEQLSFSSQSFFTAAFRRATGLTPRQFREIEAR